MTLHVEPSAFTASSVNTASAAALSSGVNVVCCPAGTYDLDTTIDGADNLRIIGAGPGLTVFRLSSLLQGYAVNGYAAQNFGISDMTFDMGGFIPVDTAWPDLGSGVALFGGSQTSPSKDCFIDRVEVLNAGTYCVNVRGGTMRFRSDGCRFFNPDFDGANFKRFGFMLRAAGEGGPNAYPAITNLYTEGMCGFGGSMLGGIFAHARLRFTTFGAGFAGDGDDTNGWNTRNTIEDVTCENALITGNGANGGFEYWGTNSHLSKIHALNNAGFGFGINRGPNVLSGAISAGNATGATNRYGVELFFDQPDDARLTMIGVISQGNTGGRDYINHKPGAVITAAGNTFAA